MVSLVRRLLCAPNQRHFPHLIAVVRKYSKSSYCNIQNNFMNQDMCFVTSEDDTVLFTASKKDCHFQNGLLHRAFSLFLFRNLDDNDSGNVELLMQQRSTRKITFPSLWSNTCCSHPLATEPGEHQQEHAWGVKLAAQRKVVHELGIDGPRFLPIEKIHFLTRILYSAHNEPVDGIWLEREIDYILLCILPKSETIQPNFLSVNQNEVLDSAWVGENAFASSLLRTEISRYTPWFRGLLLTGLFQRMWNWAAAKAFLDSCKLEDHVEYARRFAAFQCLDAQWDRTTVYRMPYKY